MPDILSVTKPNPPQHRLKGQIQTWWLIPVGKWIITPVISELTLLSPVITRGITYLLSGGEPPSNNNDKLMIRL